MQLTHRPRRLRRSAAIRRLVQETVLTVHDLIYPIFVMEGDGEPVAIPSMPGCFRYSLERLLLEIKTIAELGIPGIALFPVIPEEKKR